LKRLFRRAESFDDSAETVIERLLDEVDDQTEGAAGAGSVSSDNQGDLLPEGEYWIPILELLAESGGRAQGRSVIAALEDRLKGRLTARDYEVLDMGEIRWSNRARFARLRMKERGLISKRAPRGIWEITDAGRRHLAAHIAEGG
jgi:hypothetical protein